MGVCRLTNSCVPPGSNEVCPYSGDRVDCNYMSTVFKGFLSVCPRYFLSHARLFSFLRNFVLDLALLTDSLWPG